MPKTFMYKSVINRTLIKRSATAYFHTSKCDQSKCSGGRCPAAVAVSVLRCSAFCEKIAVLRLSAIENKNQVADMIRTTGTEKDRSSAVFCSSALLRLFRLQISSPVFLSLKTTSTVQPIRFANDSNSALFHLSRLSFLYTFCTVQSRADARSDTLMSLRLAISCIFSAIVIIFLSPLRKGLYNIKSMVARVKIKFKKIKHFYKSGVDKLKLLV